MKLRYQWVDRDDLRGDEVDLYFDEEDGLRSAEVPGLIQRRGLDAVRGEVKKSNFRLKKRLMR